MNIKTKLHDVSMAPELMLVAPGAAGAGANLSIIVLDDEPDVAETIVAMLCSLGHDARCTFTSDSFFRDLERNHADLAIIDLMMPGEDGLEVMRKISMNHDLRILLTSGYDTRVLDSARLSARSHGLEVIGILPKPVRRSVLKQALVDIQPQATNPSRLAPLPVRLNLSAEMLRTALAEGQIVPYFQPKIRLTDGSLCGFEALARWDHPELGLIPPLDFLPVVAEAGLDLELFETMLEQALHSLAELARPDFAVSVNVPMRLCERPDFLDLLTQAITTHGLTPSHLMLEVTEAGPNKISLEAVDALTRLRLNGFALSIDDFGTGSSSLERLVRIPFDELKIDRYFARDIASSSRGTGVVRNLVQWGKTLGMSITIEGIEDEAGMTMSRDLGCDVIQGYHVSPPVPLDTLRSWVAAFPDEGLAS